MLFYSCHLKHPISSPLGGNPLLFWDPTWQTIGVFLAGVLTTVVVIRKMWARGLIRRWRLREEGIKTVNRGWDRPASLGGGYIRRKRNKRVENDIKSPKKRKRERRGGKKEHDADVLSHSFYSWACTLSHLQLLTFAL